MFPICRDDAPTCDDAITIVLLRPEL